MSDSISLEAIKNEIIRYGKANPLDLQGTVLSKDIALNKLNPTVYTKVKGKWTFPHILLGHVVQAFSDKWTAYGQIQFAKKAAKDFHQKLNFLISPYSIYGSWIEELWEENKTPAEMSISQYIINKVLPPMITSDLDILSVNGKFNPVTVGSPTPVFGEAMDGINTIVDNMILDAENPVFLIPVDTSLNIVDRVTAFEKSLPENSKVDTIIMSLTEFNDYVTLRETPSDKFIDYNDPTRGKTKFGRNIVGIPGLKQGRILGWVMGNFGRFYDRKDNPAIIDDVQVMDYDVKVFSNWHLGWDWAINQMVFVETHDATKNRGLNNTTQNKLYWPKDFSLTT